MGEWGGAGGHPGSPLFRPAADRTGWRGCCRPTHRGRCRWGRGKRGAVWARGAGRARGPTTRRPSPSRRRPGERREGGGRHGRMRTVNNGHAHGSAATPTHLDAQAVGACDDNAGRRFRDDDRTAHRRGRDRGGARDAGQGELELSVGEEVALRGGGGGRQPRWGRTSKTPRRLAQSSHRPHIAASDARILTLSHHGVLRLKDARASRKSSGERIEAALANSDDAAATMAATGTPRGTAANSWDGCGGREWVLEGARRSAERGRSKTCGQVRTWAEIGAGDSLRHSAPSFPGRERGAPFRTTRQSKARSSVDAKVCSLSILRVRVAESAPCTANSIGACSNLGGGCACKTRTCAPKSAEKYRAQTHHGGLRLPAARVRRAIWEHHAVDAKLGVVRLIPKVAAVRPAFDGGAVGRGEGFVEALVDPVPNEAAL